MEEKLNQQKETAERLLKEREEAQRLELLKLREAEERALEEKKKMEAEADAKV